METITVINGSPKGKKSISLKFVEYLQKKHPQTDFRYFHVAKDIRLYSRGADAWNPLKEALGASQGVLWVFPVYVFQAPASLMRFMELIAPMGAAKAFSGLYTACLSTSIHFYDNFAHDQMRGTLEDLGMSCLAPFQADQDDFFKPRAMEALEYFFEDFLQAARDKRPVQRKFAPLTFPDLKYQPSEPTAPVSSGKKVAIVAETEAGGNIGPMVERLAKAFGGKVDIVDLQKLTIRGACLGCMKCAFDNQCTYGDKDDIKRIYETILDPADIIVYAGPVVNRFFPARMKLFVERRFMRTHYPFMKGKQVALLVAGPLCQCHTLYDTFEADVQVSEAHFAGAVSDEYPNSASLDRAIDTLARQLASGAEACYLPPDNFFGVAGRKMFRDEVWGRYRFVFQADHRYYSRRGFYDFPQKDWRMRLRNFWNMLRLRIPRLRRQVRNTMPGFMVKPFVDKLNKL